MSEESEESEFGPPPAALPDGRTVYRKLGDSWVLIELRDAVPDDLIAVIADPKLNPDDVQLWIVNGVPYQLPNGQWSVKVLPASGQHKCVEKQS